MDISTLISILSFLWRVAGEHASTPSAWPSLTADWQAVWNWMFNSSRVMVLSNFATGIGTIVLAIVTFLTVRATERARRDELRPIVVLSHRSNDIDESGTSNFVFDWRNVGKGDAVGLWPTIANPYFKSHRPGILLQQVVEMDHLGAVISSADTTAWTGMDYVQAGSGSQVDEGEWSRLV